MIFIAGILSFRPKAVQRKAKLVLDLAKEIGQKAWPVPSSGPDLIPPGGAQLCGVLISDSKELGDAGNGGESDAGKSHNKDPSQVVQTQLLEHNCKKTQKCGPRLYDFHLCTLHN